MTGGPLPRAGGKPHCNSENSFVPSSRRRITGARSVGQMSSRGSRFAMGIVAITVFVAVSINGHSAGDRSISPAVRAHCHVDGIDRDRRDYGICARINRRNTVDLRNVRRGCRPGSPPPLQRASRTGRASLSPIITIWPRGRRISGFVVGSTHEINRPPRPKHRWGSDTKVMAPAVQRHGNFAVKHIRRRRESTADRQIGSL
jgi:hypothetical protein